MTFSNIYIHTILYNVLLNDNNGLSEGFTKGVKWKIKQSIDDNFFFYDRKKPKCFSDVFQEIFNENKSLW